MKVQLRLSTDSFLSHSLAGACGKRRVMQEQLNEGVVFVIFIYRINFDVLVANAGGKKTDFPKLLLDSRILYSFHNPFPYPKP